MGWTSEYFDGTMREYQDYVLDSYLTPHKLLAYNRKGNNLYCAVDTNGIVYGLVILCSKTKDEFFYKMIDEVMHPYYYQASAKVLALLSTTESENATSWRKECRKLIDQGKDKSYYIIKVTHVSGGVMYLNYKGGRYKKEIHNKMHTIEQGTKTMESCNRVNATWEAEIIKRD